MFAGQPTRINIVRPGRGNRETTPVEHARATCDKNSHVRSGPRIRLRQKRNAQNIVVEKDGHHHHRRGGILRFGGSKRRGPRYETARAVMAVHPLRRRQEQKKVREYRTAGCPRGQARWGLMTCHEPTPMSARLATTKVSRTRRAPDSRIPRRLPSTETEERPPSATRSDRPWGNADVDSRYNRVANADRDGSAKVVKSEAHRRHIEGRISPRCLRRQMRRHRGNTHNVCGTRTRHHQYGPIKEAMGFEA